MARGVSLPILRISTSSMTFVFNSCNSSSCINFAAHCLSSFILSTDFYKNCQRKILVSGLLPGDGELPLGLGPRY